MEGVGGALEGRVGGRAECGGVRLKERAERREDRVSLIGKGTGLCAKRAAQGRAVGRWLGGCWVTRAEVLAGLGKEPWLSADITRPKGGLRVSAFPHCTPARNRRD